MILPPNVKMTPMLSQYVEWKKKYPDCLLFFRMGDFYEMFLKAQKASEILDIALTSRDPSRYSYGWRSVPCCGQLPWKNLLKQVIK